MSACWTCGERNRTKAHPAWNCQPQSERLLAHKREIERRWRQIRLVSDETCPDCGSGAYVDGACSSCGRLPQRPVRMRPRTKRPCRQHDWQEPTVNYAGGMGTETSVCRRCRQLRITEA